MALVQIDLTTAATHFGDMTAGLNLAASFNGSTSSAGSACSQKSSVSNVMDAYVGRPLDVPKRIGQFRIFGANNNGFVGTDNPTVTIRFYGKTGVAPTTATDGTEIAQLVFTDTADESAGRTVAVTDATVWAHIWARFTHNNGTARSVLCAEVHAWAVTPLPHSMHYQKLRRA